MITYYCLVCGQLKQGDVHRTELNVCEDCSANDADEGKRCPILRRVG